MKKIGKFNVVERFHINGTFNRSSTLKLNVYRKDDGTYCVRRLGNVLPVKRKGDTFALYRNVTKVAKFNLDIPVGTLLQHAKAQHQGVKEFVQEFRSEIAEEFPEADMDELEQLLDQDAANIDKQVREAV